MSRPNRIPILKAEQSYTFHSYFKFKFPISQILKELNFEFQVQDLPLPQLEGPLSATLQTTVLSLKERLERRRLRVRLTSELARRETLIAPVVMEVADLTESIVNIEYPIEVSPFLNGDLDYYLEAAHGMLVVEAKQADLTRGFTQLAVELIALDQWVELSDPLLYGAVTTGEIWLFGCLDRAARQVTQDVKLYRVPADLEPLMRILLGILSQKPMA